MESSSMDTASTREGWSVRTHSVKPRLRIGIGLGPRRGAPECERYDGVTRFHLRSFDATGIDDVWEGEDPWRVTR